MTGRRSRPADRICERHYRCRTARSYISISGLLSGTDSAPIYSPLWAYGKFIVHKAVGFSAINGAFKVIELPCVNFRTCFFDIVYVIDVLLIPGAIVVMCPPWVARHVGVGFYEFRHVAFRGLTSDIRSLITHPTGYPIKPRVYLEWFCGQGPP